MSEKLTPIKTGIPDDGYLSNDQNHISKGASFSRFVLPFAYKVTKIKVGKEEPDLYFEQKELNNLSFIKRRKYFTKETGLTLYERAKWFNINEEQWGETCWGACPNIKEKKHPTVKIDLYNDIFTLAMLPPKAVLFEATGELINLASEDQSFLHTGFLILDLYFPKQEKTPDINDLLLLNENFRYFGTPGYWHATDFINRFDLSFLATKNSSEDTPQKGSRLNNQANPANYFDRWNELLKLPIKDGENHYQFFPGDWADNAEKLNLNESQSEGGNWQILADNRSYVWSAAIMPKGAKSLLKPSNKQSPPIMAKEYDHWVRLLNVDKPSDYPISEFERNWANKRTYKRWESSASFYGYSTHSGVAIGSEEFVFEPFSTHYFDTSLLLYFIRMSLFRFSSELAEISHNTKSDNTDWMSEQFRELRKRFSKFTILYQFPLVSNQQQSLEMFELNREFFDIKELFNEIQQEIESTHEFLESIKAFELGKSANNLANAANYLAKWGVPLAAGGLIAGIFGMNNFHFTKFNDPKYEFQLEYLIEGFLVVFIAAITGWVVSKSFKKGDK